MFTCFDLRQTGSFSVTDPFLTAFYYVKNEVESYVRIGRRGLKNLTYPYVGVGAVKNCQNHPYVINEWPLRGFICVTDYLYYALPVWTSGGQSKMGKKSQSWRDL